MTVRHGRVEGHRGCGLQSLLGHESLATTQAYIYDSADDLRQAVDGMLSYRSHKGVRVMQPEKILEAYGPPIPLINKILNGQERRIQAGPAILLTSADPTWLEIMAGLGRRPSTWFPDLSPCFPWPRSGWRPGPP